MNNFLLGFLAASILLWAAFMVRVEVTYRVRLAILWTRTKNDAYAGNALYEMLPSFDSMAFAPMYWRMWTTTQWRAFISEKQGAAS